MTHYDTRYLTTTVSVAGKTYDVIRKCAEIKVDGDLDTYTVPAVASDIVAIRAVWASPTTSRPCRRELKLTARTARRVIKHITALVLPTIVEVQAIYRMDDSAAKHFLMTINIHMFGLVDTSDGSIIDAYNAFWGY